MINKDITLSGGWDAGFTTQSGMSTIDGQGTVRGISINSSVTAIIERFTLQNGSSPFSGGGIYNFSGSLELINSIIINNASSGILNRDGGTVTLTNSTVSNNTSNSGNGGGINNNSSNSTVILTNSIVSGNSASTGGGIYNNGTLTIDNSTISGNTATFGGGIENYGLLTLSNSTVSNNSASIYPGGIFFGFGTSGSATLKNTIIAGNFGFSGFPDCSGGTLNSQGYNIIKDAGDCAITGDTTGNLIGIDPMLGPLQNNGGATFTQALLAGSPAVDAGNPTGCTDQNNNLLATDQRGISRPQGARCDIGAFELEGGAGPAPANDNFANPEAITALPFSAIVDITWAGIESGEPQNCESSAKTVWYSFTPSTNVAVKVDMDGSSFNDTIFNIYQDAGAGLTGLSFMQCTYYGSPAAFSLRAGVTYYIQAGSIYSAGGDLHLNMREVFPPANDNFGNAMVIGALPFSDTVNSYNATTEFNEPQSCSTLPNTVWYSFTPMVNATVRMDMAGSSISETNVNLYQSTGSGIGSLSFLTCTSYYGNSVAFSVQAGVTYYLQVGSFNNVGGDLQLNLQEVFPPANDSFGNAAVIGALPFSDTVNNIDTFTEAGEPQACYYTPKTVWYSFTPTANALVRADMQGSSISETILNIYQDTGSGIGGLSFLQCASYGNSVTFSVQAGVTYYFQAGSFNSVSGDLHLNLQEILRPANDDFGSAKAVGSLPFSDSVDITNATAESGEPQYCYYSNKTVWYSFTPTANALVKADMAGSAFSDTIFNVYQSSGSGFGGLSFMQCGYFGNSVTFNVQAGTTYYIQAGSIYGSSGNLQLNLQELPRPANDDFTNAMIVSSPLPFDNTVDTQYSSRQTSEPTPSCAYYGAGTRSVWYAFTPTTSGSVSASIPASAFTPVFAAYTGNSLASLTQVGCQTYSGSLITFHVNAGTTYYFQVGNLYPWDQGGPMQFHLDVTPQPVAGFYYYPSDPSVFDTIQFYDGSSDPGQVGFNSFTWNFGDGSTATGSSPTHKYAKDGDYTVQHSATTVDGRTASITQVVHVKTHDVAITKINAPQSASAKQTRTITISVNSKGYAETVRIDLYKSVAGGFEYVGSITQLVPASSSKKTVTFSFNYTFTSGDASIGKVTFKAVATIVGARDSYPSDNEAISSPPTKVTK